MLTIKAMVKKDGMRVVWAVKCHTVRRPWRSCAGGRWPRCILVVVGSYASLMIDKTNAKIDKIIRLSIVFFVPLHRI